MTYPRQNCGGVNFCVLWFTPPPSREYESHFAVVFGIGSHGQMETAKVATMGSLGFMQCHLWKSNQN